MANEEILELQIRDNAAVAATGLVDLATALGKVKDAIGKGLRLTGTVNSLEKLKETIASGFSEESISKIERLAHALETLKSVGAVKVSGLKNLNKQMDISEPLKDAKDQAQEAATGIAGRFDGAMEHVESRMVEAAENVTKPFEGLDDRAARSSTAIAEAAASIRNSLANIGKQTLSGIKTAFTDLARSANNLRTAIGGVLGGFTRIAKYRFIRFIIKQITEAFSTGVKNVYNYSKAIGSDFAPSMDSAASALATMKNALGAMTAPLLQSLIPAFNNVVNAVIEAVNWVNQFLALMRGQKTWTRAIPQTVNAFDDQKKAAKGASKAIKELLADWDELNIIQSETGGGGSGTAKKAEDYLHMFEEVSEFDSDVKNIIKFIEDHMGGISNLANDIGIAIAAWKLSTLFTGQLANIASLAAGVMITKIGVELASGAGYEAGIKGYIDKDEALEGIGGVLATAIGGALIGTALPIPGGTAVGAVIGLSVGLAAWFKAYADGAEYADNASRWGDVELTADELEKKAKELFDFDIPAKINITKISVENYQSAKKRVDYAASQFSASLAKARISYQLGTGDPVKDLDDAYGAAQQLIADVNARIAQNTDMFAITIQNMRFVDNEGKDISDELLGQIKIHDTSLQSYFTDLGKKMADWMYKGQQSGWQHGEMEQIYALMESQERIVNGAEKYQKEIEFETKIKSVIKNTDFSNLTYESAQALYDQISSYTEDYRNILRDQIDSERENAVWSASLAQSIIDESESKINELRNKIAESDNQEDIRGWEKEMKEYEDAILKATEDRDFYKELAEKWLIPEEVEKEVNKRLNSSLEKIKGLWISSFKKVYGTSIQGLMGKSTQQEWFGQYSIDYETALKYSFDSNGKQGAIDAINDLIRESLPKAGQEWVDNVSKEMGFSLFALLTPEDQADVYRHIADLYKDAEDPKEAQKTIDEIMLALFDSNKLDYAKMLHYLGLDDMALETLRWTLPVEIEINGEKVKVTDALFTQIADEIDGYYSNDSASIKRVQEYLDKKYGKGKYKASNSDIGWLNEYLVETYGEELKEAGYIVRDMWNNDPSFGKRRRTGVTDEGSYLSEIDYHGTPSVEALQHETEQVDGLKQTVQEDAEAIIVSAEEAKEALESIGDTKIDTAGMNDLYEEIKRKIDISGLNDDLKADYNGILEALYGNNRMDGLQRLSELIKEFEVFGGFKEFEKWTDENFRITLPDRGQITRPAPMFSNGNADNGQMNWQQTNNDAINNVEAGVKAGNAPQNEILTAIGMTLAQIAQKQWTVNVTPSATLGAVTAGATVMYNRISGQG